MVRALPDRASRRSYPALESYVTPPSLRARADRPRRRAAGHVSAIADVIAEPGGKADGDSHPYGRHERGLGVELPHHRIDARQDDDANLQDRIAHGASEVQRPV